MEDLAPVIGSVSFFIVTGWVIKMILTHRRQIRFAQLQYELQTKLLDKFTSTGEIAEYLRGDVGQRFLESATVERSNPYARILGSVQASLVLLTGGAALLLVQGRISGADEALVFLGTLGVALGVGFGLSAAIAYTLSKAWGVINGGPSQPTLPERS
jgi:hypothetical protein